jgi:hypothetical protein
VIGADRRRSAPSCVLPKGVPQGQTESGGIVLAAICWATSAQRRLPRQSSFFEIQRGTAQGALWQLILSRRAFFCRLPRRLPHPPIPCGPIGDGRRETDRDKGSVKDLVYGNIAMVRVLSDSEASGDRQQGSTHQVWDGEEGSAHPMPEALEDLWFFTLPLPPIVVAPLPHRALYPATRLVLGKAPHTKPHHVFHVALGHERDAQRFVLASRGLFTVEQ